MRFTVFLLATVMLLTSVFAVQPPSQRPGRGRRPGPPPEPYLALFDTNKDGQLSGDEIDKASSVLRALDRNGDGLVTREELPRPRRPGQQIRQRQNRAENPRQQSRSEPASQTRDGHEQPNDARRQPPRVIAESEIAAAAKGTVFFQGGYETDRRDSGRPVVLIAAALDVPIQVFRDAFSNVRPARSGAPTEVQAQANKKVLMEALGPHGITNERLDEVSNYYRYNHAQGEHWTYRPAKATVIVRDGRVVGFNMMDGGFGYTTPPKVIVAGYPQTKVKARLAFGTDFRTNGSIKSLTVVNR